MNNSLQMYIFCMNNSKRSTAFLTHNHTKYLLIVIYFLFFYK